MGVMLYIFFGIVAISGIALVTFMVRDAKAHPSVRCYVKKSDRPIYGGPGPEYRQVGRTKVGEVVVVGSVGDWWKLRNGRYIHKDILEPVNALEYPVEL